jgi:hypothetical protein
MLIVLNAITYLTLRKPMISGLMWKLVSMRLRAQPIFGVAVRSVTTNLLVISRTKEQPNDSIQQTGAAEHR